MSLLIDICHFGQIWTTFFFLKTFKITFCLFCAQKASGHRSDVELLTLPLTRQLWTLSWIKWVFSRWLKDPQKYSKKWHSMSTCIFLKNYVLDQCVWSLKWILVKVKGKHCTLECTCVCKGLFVSKGSKTLVPWEYQLSVHSSPLVPAVPAPAQDFPEWGQRHTCHCSGSCMLLTLILTLSLPLFLCGPRRSQKTGGDTSANWSFPLSCVVLPHITVKV